MEPDMLQTREERGATIRTRLAGLSVVDELRRLTPAHRVEALEALEAAHSADRKADLGGARLLDQVSRRLETPGPVCLVTRRAATAFVRPRRS